ncbi:MAG: hypothetical protein IT162_09715 [Bryobacterales bacterium]|nr:hypothetical protein [Bryobacterales bacterium]
MQYRRRAVAFLLSLGLTVQVAYSVPPVPADGGQVQTESAPAILRIRVVEGEGSIHTAGSRSNQPIVVVLSDEAGRLVEGASVSVRLPDEAPTGLFANGMRTDIALTGPDGRVVIRGIQWSRAAGPVQLRITASKGEARAGILSTQYITEPSGAQASRRGPDPATGPPRPPARIEQPSRSKWILLAALIGGAAAGGVAAAARGGSTAPGAPPAVTPPAVVQPSATIGSPTITVGRP